MSFTFKLPAAPSLVPVPVAVEFDPIPVVDPVALALNRLPQQYRGDDDVPTELLVS